MKEHALFLEVGYTEANCDFKKEAKAFKKAFEKLLHDAIMCSNGIITQDIFNAGEVITEYTLCSEKATCKLTGTTIDTDLTNMEMKLWKACREYSNTPGCGLENEVKKLNQRCLQLLDSFIEFKQATLKNVLKCRMFTMNYPLLLEHIIREAKLYEQYIKNLEKRGNCQEEDMRCVELFWNQIMMEHALFIRGLLDPTETDLIAAADQFAGDYATLLQQARNMTQQTMEDITDETLKATIKYRDFKIAGTKGINECGIKSLILPLLADHVLREANHYIRILNRK